MTELLFLRIGRPEITWIVAAAPPPSEAAVSRGGVAALAADAARCGAVVAWGARKQLDALAKVAPTLAALTAVELPGAAPTGPYDARAVAAAYFAADGGLLPPGCRPSAEQWAVANAAAGRGLNVVCRAVAGAGKTTTLLLCAARAPDKAHLLVTYNKRLAVEVGRRARPNVAVMTYHAAAGRSYGTVIRNDEQFRRYVRAAPETPLRFDVLLVDESQDMAVEYFALVRHLLAANPGARMIVVGDELQSINEYRGAHPGFLTEAPALYRDLAGGREWVSCRLSVSHRLTPASAAFVNAHLYRAEILVGGNLRDADRRPLYIAAAAGKEGVAKALAAATKDAIAEFGAEGVFVLAPSVRGLASKQSPVAELVRRHLAGVPVYVAGDDDARVDEALTRGKLAIMSFNAVKGCERPCVIIVGLDETYFLYFNREWKDRHRLPNILTVAATRAIARLVVVASARSTLRTVLPARLGELAEVRGEPARPRVRAAPKPRKTNVSVTQLVRHLHPETVRAAMALVFAAGVADEAPRECPRVEGRVRFEGGAGPLTEDLLFVYGTLAPVLAEVARRGGSDFGAELESPEIVATPEEVEPFGNQITEDEYAAYPPQFWELVSGALASDSADRSPAEWAVLAVAHHAIRDGRHHIARQVAHYDWVDGAALVAARDIVLRALAGVDGDFEVRTPRVDVGLRSILGVADFVERESGVVWEFKLGELCEEHELQLACYLALRGGGEGRLMSILCRETRSVTVAAEDAGALLAILAERAAAPGRPVAQLVADFDAGLDPEPAGDGAEEEPPYAAGAWTLDDVL